jgi:hypothetical protein
METTDRLIVKGVVFFTEGENKYKMVTTVSLDDECRNNIYRWGIYADIYWRGKNGIYKKYATGACYDEIEKYCPELKKFILLHNCDHYGAPLYPVENGMYYVKNRDKSEAIEYLRISDKEYFKLSEVVDDKLYFKYLLFALGIVDRWRHESNELLVELENLCGKKWVNPYKPEEERVILTLTDEERSLIEERIEAGYYSTENIEKRKEEAHQAAIAKERANICKRFDEKILEAETEKKIHLYILDHGLPIDNTIFYSHKNTVVFNWRDYGDKITQEEFVNFVNNIDYSQLPEGIKFEIK